MDTMSFHQRLHSIGLVIGLVAVGAYVVVVTLRAVNDGLPLTDVAWQGPMLWVVLAGAGLYAVVVGLDYLRLRNRGECVEDIRDREINRYAEFSSRGLLDIVVLAAIIMLALGAPTFWTVHVLFLGSYLASLGTSGATLAAYREGIPS